MSDVGKISGVLAGEHAVALPSPLRIGPLEVAERHYTSVRVTTEDGQYGEAIAQSRGAPIAAVIERLFAPVLVGRDADDPEARTEKLFRATIGVGRVGLVLRALSLVDLALWDLRGRLTGRPVRDLLGGTEDTVAVTYVAGYPRESADVEKVVDSAVRAAAAGHGAVKVARTPDSALTRAMLEALACELPAEVELQVDANWFWRTVDEATAEIRGWPSDRLAWIEDPFPPEQESDLVSLRSRTGVPLAVGDELADPAQARRLLRSAALDVLRVDVATIGGISAARPLIEDAERADVPVSFHISPETSIHLACTFEATTEVETFDRTGNPFDPAHELIVGGPTFSAGTARLDPASPGLGFRLAPTQST